MKKYFFAFLCIFSFMTFASQKSTSDVFVLETLESELLIPVDIFDEEVSNYRDGLFFEKTFINNVLKSRIEISRKKDQENIGSREIIRLVFRDILRKFRPQPIPFEPLTVVCYVKNNSGKLYFGIGVTAIEASYQAMNQCYLESSSCNQLGCDPKIY